MPNRILRAELLESEGWLALKDNADRCAYIACLLTVDTFGNMPAGAQRLVRLWRPYGIDTPEKAAKAASDLQDVDLIRRYENERKPYLHIPRFRQSRRFLGHLWPLSPWTTIEEKQRLGEKSLVDHQSTPVIHREPPLGVGVGVGVGVGEKQSQSPVLALSALAVAEPPASKKATRLLGDWRLPDDWLAWAVRVHHLDPQRAVRISLAFRDYWIAKPGKDGCKLDWAATWRNWIRKECGDA